MPPTLHRGKLAIDPKIIEVRPLTRDDLLCLREKRPAQGVVKTFRDSHHKIARLVAAGLKPGEVALRAGITVSRVGSLKGDPAFIELVAQYRLKVDEAFVEGVGDYYEVATANMLKAEVMLSDKLDEAIDSGELLPTKDLLAISRDAADRFGHPKQKVSQNTNVNVDFAAMLEATARRSGRSNVIDGVSSRTSPSGARAVGYSADQPAKLVPSPTPSSDVAGIRRRA